MRKSRRQPVDPWPEGIFWSEHKTDSFFTCGKPWPWRISGDLPKKQKGSCAFFLAHRDFRKRIASVWPVQSTENRAELDTFGKSSCGRVRTKWYPFAHGAAGWLSGEWAEAQELGTKKAIMSFKSFGENLLNTNKKQIKNLRFFFLSRFLKKKKFKNRAKKLLIAFKNLPSTS